MSFLAWAGNMLIGLTGEKRTGKSTVANILKRFGFIELTFSEPLKQAAAFLFDRSDLDQYKEDLIPEYSFTYRQFLQMLGTDFIRDSIDADFWVKKLSGKLKSLQSQSKNIVISDVRFDNEADFVLRNGGNLVKICRMSPDNAIDRHKSESGINDSFPVYPLSNMGTFQELEMKVLKIILLQGVVKQDELSYNKSLT